MNKDLNIAILMIFLLILIISLVAWLKYSLFVECRSQFSFFYCLFR